MFKRLAATIVQDTPDLLNCLSTNKRTLQQACQNINDIRGKPIKGSYYFVLHRRQCGYKYCLNLDICQKINGSKIPACGSILSTAVAVGICVLHSRLCHSLVAQGSAH